MIGNAIGTFFQRKNGIGGLLPPIPSLKGCIGFYMAKGLINEQMSANPVWKDKSGKGNDLQMKNFLWRLGSGCGSYKLDFTTFTPNGGELSRTFSSFTYSVKGNDNATIYNTLVDVGYVYDFNVRIEGLSAGVTASFLILGSDSVVFEKDGIYNIHLEMKEEATQKRLYFRIIRSSSSINATVKVTQIPDYSGAIVFDGVDDYGICETFPILTKEKGYTVMALRKYITDPVVKVSSGLASKNVSPNYGAFCFEFSDAGLLNTRSFGKLTRLNQFPDLITWQCSENFNDIDILSGDALDTEQLSVGRHSNNYANVALYSLVIIDHDTTEEEHQLVIDYWKKEFPWLFFDQAWTVTGKTNEDSDRATIANLTGNGNYLVLSNFLFAENSGYGDYVHNWNKWELSTARAEGSKQNNLVNITKILSISAVVFFYQITDSSVGGMEVTTLPFKVKITGLVDGQTIRYKFGTDQFVIDKDGIYDLPSLTSTASTGGYYFYGFFFGKTQESCDITIEQIPDYEGYLVTDGVDDKILSSNFNLGKDWTIVGDWKFMSVDENVLAGMSKSSSFFLYNYAAGIRIYINSAGSAITINGVRSVNAICSDGRIYLNNWAEVINDQNQTVSGSNIGIIIGYNGNNFTQVAFKNLGIYNNRILSKEQCIQAYNYLQLQKAK